MNALMKKLLSLLLVLCMLLGAGAAFADDAVEAGSVWYLRRMDRADDSVDFYLASGLDMFLILQEGGRAVLVTDNEGEATVDSLARWSLEGDQLTVTESTGYDDIFTVENGELKAETENGTMVFTREAPALPGAPDEQYCGEWHMITTASPQGVKTTLFGTRNGLIMNLGEDGSASVTDGYTEDATTTKGVWSVSEGYIYFKSPGSVASIFYPDGDYLIWEDTSGNVAVLSTTAPDGTVSALPEAVAAESVDGLDGSWILLSALDSNASSDYSGSDPASRAKLEISGGKILDISINEDGTETRTEIPVEFVEGILAGTETREGYTVGYQFALLEDGTLVCRISLDETVTTIMVYERYEAEAAGEAAPADAETAEEAAPAETEAAEEDAAPAEETAEAESAPAETTDANP